MVIEDTHLQNACQLLQTGGYHYVPNGRIIFVRIEATPKMSVLRLFENAQISIVDFDVTDSYAVPTNEDLS